MILVRKCLHTGFFALLGLLFLAGCVRDPDSCEEAERVTEGPVNVSLTLALKAFGSDGSITKADFVDVDDSLHYAHEKVLKNFGIFLYNASDAFEVDPGTSKYKFNPALATRIGTVEPVHTESLEKGAKLRVDFDLASPYTSLAVLVLGNYGTGSYSYSSSTDDNLQDDVTAFSQEAVSLPAQSSFISGGIPMHGWMVFGSLEGLDAGADDAQKQKEIRQLKYYKGMSTPLTKYGFRDADELAAYASATTGRGTVSIADCVPMRYALSRLQLRYVPDAGEMAADSVEVLWVKLNVHRKEFLKLPAGLLSGSTATPFDAVTDVGDFSEDVIEFTQVSSVSEKSSAWVAYVPEIDSVAVKTAVTGNQIAEPALEVAVKVTPRYGSAGETVTFTYSGDGVTMDDGVNPPVYENPGWTSWLKFRTIYARKDKDDNDIPVGTMYNLVRHYSYEWIATGVDR